MKASTAIKALEAAKARIMQADGASFAKVRGAERAATTILNNAGFSAAIVSSKLHEYMLAVSYTHKDGSVRKFYRA